MKRTKGRKGGVAIKEDLSKAYERIKWSFVQLVFKVVGISDKLCDIIMACITSVQTNLLWNRNRNDFVHP